MRKDDVVNRFLQQYAADWASGEARALTAYLDDYPGFEEVIREQHALLVAEAGAQGGRASERIGPFELQRLLGRGGQGEVWLAEDERLGRPVALKVLRGLDRVGPREAARLEREAILTSRLSHPAICPIYEAGSVEGHTFIAMRHVEGMSLAKLLSQCREGEAPHARLVSPPRTAPDRSAWVSYFREAAEALAHAHERGVVHRDVKPANLFVTAEERPVLLDFGLARLLESEGTDPTRTRSLSGTPAYIAPEQLSLPEGVRDPRVDVYALGVTMYEALSGKRPFEGPTRDRLFRAILEEEPVRLIDREPTLPRELCTVVETAMARRPEHRYATAQALAADLARVGLGEPITARPTPRWRRALRIVRRHPAKATMLAALLLLAIASGWLAMSWGTFRDGRNAQREALVQGHLEEGFLEASEGDAERAVQAFEAARSLVGDRPLILSGLAITHLERRDHEAAREVLERVPSEAPWRASLLASAELLAVGPERDAPLVGAQVHPQTPTAWFVEGHRRLMHGHRGRQAAFKESVDALLESLAHPDPDPAFLYFVLADALSHAPREGWNRRIADILEERWPDRARALQLVGMLARTFDPERAERVWERGFEIAPDHRIAMRLAQLLVRDGSRADAMRTWLQRAHDLAADDEDRAWVLLREGYIQRFRRDREAALESFLSSHRLDPRTTAATWEAANDLVTLGRVSEAIALCEDAIARRPHDPVAWTWLAQRDLQEGRTGLAAERLDRALGANRWYVDALHARGAAHAAAGEDAAARAVFDEAIACSPRISAARRRMIVRAALQEGDFTRARQQIAPLARNGSAWVKRASRLLLALQGDRTLEDDPVLDAELAARRAEIAGDFEAEARAWVRLVRMRQSPVSVIGPVQFHAGEAELLVAAKEDDLDRVKRVWKGIASYHESFVSAATADERLRRALGEAGARLRGDNTFGRWRDEATRPLKADEDLLQTLDRLTASLEAADALLAAP